MAENGAMLSFQATLGPHFDPKTPAIPRGVTTGLSVMALLSLVALIASIQMLERQARHHADASLPAADET